MKFQFRAKLSVALWLVLLPAFGFVAFSLLRLENLRGQVRELANAKLAALRAAASATAMQHAVRITPYRAMLGSEIGNEVEMKAAGTDARQFSTALRTALDELAKLPLGRNASESMTGAHLAMTNYLARVDELIALAFAGKLPQAHEATPEFHAAFALLRDRLTRLNTVLESETRQQLMAADELGVRSRQVAMTGGLAGALLALTLVAPFARLNRRSPAAPMPVIEEDLTLTIPIASVASPGLESAACASTTPGASLACPGTEFVPLLDRRLNKLAKANPGPVDTILREV